MKADMAKAKLAYVCSQCGGEHSKWQGQCAECGAWNTLSEFVVEQASRAGGAASAGRAGYAGSGDAAQVTRLSSIGMDSGQQCVGIGTRRSRGHGFGYHDTARKASREA